MSKQSQVEVTAPAKCPDAVPIAHGVEMILTLILIPDHLSGSTQCISAGERLANCITAGGGAKNPWMGCPGATPLGAFAC